MGVEERDASLVAALAGGWDIGRDAGPHSWDCRRTRDDSLELWRRGWRFFPLARGVEQGSHAGGKAKGSSSTVSRTGVACPWRTAARPPMVMSGRRCSRYWMPSPVSPRTNEPRSLARTRRDSIALTWRVWRRRPDEQHTLCHH